MESALRSVWHDTATTTTHAPLDADARVDVLVVGAGITGLTTAVLLAANGVEVAVVEALGIADGVTGRTTAKVTSQHSLLYSQITSKHGEDVAAVYAMANQAGVEQVASLVDVGGIDCDFQRRPAYTYTTDEPYLSKIEREVELCTRLGLPATFTHETDLPYDVLGAIRFDDQAQIQPVAYCEGLAKMLVRAGGRIWTQTRVTGVTDDGTVIVKTERGEITARSVVLATHIPLLDRGMYFAKVEPTASHGIAAEFDGPVPQGMYISAESPSRSVRSYSHDDRQYLIVVGESHRTGEGDTEEHGRALEAFTEQHWPGARVTNRWMAEDYIPQDSLPYVGKLARTSGAIFVATGFQKWGLSNGTAAAMILSDLVIGRPHPWESVFDANRLTPMASAKTFVQHNVKAGVHMVRDRLHARGLSEVDSLGPGEGTVLRVGGSQYAVSKDDEGTVCALSAVCTHLGCLVAYNAADRTWDCPCHGSRFTADGAVLHGPAVTPLEPAELPER